ncbi:MAG: tetratricopeptide repeat protein [Planctomycetota bacterium]
MDRKLTTRVAIAFISLGLLTGTGCASRGGDRYHVVQAHRQANHEAARAKSDAALEAIEVRDFDAAEQLLLDAIAANVGFGPAHNNLGKVYYEQGKLYLAAWEFEYAIKLMPHHPEPRNNLALVLETVRRFDESITHYEAALDLEPDNPELLGNLARAKLRRGDPPDEIKQLLMDLVLKDSRPEWIDWANNELAHMR